MSLPFFFVTKVLVLSLPSRGSGAGPVAGRSRASSPSVVAGLALGQPECQGRSPWAIRPSLPSIPASATRERAATTASSPKRCDNGPVSTLTPILSSPGWELLESLQARLESQPMPLRELGAALREFDAVVVRSKTKIRANHIDEAKGGKLKLIIRGGVGVDNIDVKYAEENGITVKNTPKASSESVAELALGHMFSCARYLSIAGHTMREDKWEKKAYGKGIELQGKTLGIVGFGRIGQHLGVMAKAIGMKVVAFDIFHIPGIEEQLGIPYVEMDELLAMSDFVSVHAPAVDGGALISAENIAKMKDGVVIINTSRGTNVDEAALLAALESGKVRAAGLDVYADEPATNKALYSHPMVSCTPTIGAATVEAQKRIGQEIVEIIAAM